MMPSVRLLRQNEFMTSNQPARVPPESTTNWFTRVPAWVGDALAITVALILGFLGGPIRPKGGRWDGAKSGGQEQGVGGMLETPWLDIAIPIAIVLVAVALIPFRRRFPLPIFVAAFVLYCATVLMREPSMGVGFVVILTAFSLGARTTRNTTLIAGGLATIIAAALSLTSSKFGVIDTRVFQIAAGLAVAAALGDSSRSHREFVIAANERAERAEQSREAEAQQRVAEERLRIAQDLHDTVAHQISVISLNAGAASSALTTNPEKAKTALGTIRISAREVLSEIGTLLNYLRTDQDSAAAPPQPDLNDVPTLIARMQDSGLAIEIETHGDLAAVSGASSRVAYRVIQEGLTNANKHGSGNRAEVELTVSHDELTITMTNPTSGAAKNQPDAPNGGLGLTGIRERVASVGGTVDISTNGQFVITATLPLKREATS